MADVTAVFGSRSAFSFTYSASSMFDDAKEINPAGLSLNILYQSYPGHRLARSRDRLDNTSAQRLELHVYGEMIRFNFAHHGRSHRG
ncbi:hypothetical protein ACFOY2_36055 [Nonomuraea purpurea]|uniref:Uncharacterized protein n=1 Tax=Nonomuraea purpurea TaxID=1849276 RepID=A0ABV8GFH8_9ACTN